MKAIGWEDGHNARFLFVWAEGASDRAPELAGGLVAQKVDVIITFRGPVRSSCTARLGNRAGRRNGR